MSLLKRIAQSLQESDPDENFPHSPYFDESGVSLKVGDKVEDWGEHPYTVIALGRARQLKMFDDSGWMNEEGLEEFDLTWDSLMIACQDESGHTAVFVNGPNAGTVSKLNEPSQAHSSTTS